MGRGGKTKSKNSLRSLAAGPHKAHLLWRGDRGRGGEGQGQDGRRQGQGPQEGHEQHLQVKGRPQEAGRKFNRKQFGLSLGLKNGLIFGLRFP